MVCDSNSQTLERISASNPGIIVTTEFDDVLDDEEVRGVVIASPAALHHSMARRAIEAGKDVFIEKPMALSYAEGKELMELAEERGVLPFG